MRAACGCPGSSNGVRRTHPPRLGPARTHAGTDVAQVTDVSVSTIRSTYREFYSMREELFPPPNELPSGFSIARPIGELTNTDI